MRSGRTSAALTSSTARGNQLRSTSVGRWTRAGSTRVFRPLTPTLRFAFAATAAFATGATLSLARQGQPLQVTEVHPGQPNGRLQIFTEAFCCSLVSILFRLALEEP